MKSTPLLLSLTALLALSLALPAHGQIPVRGDVDGNGLINAIDIQLAINAALGIPIDAAFNADVNRDNAVNSVDVQLVINAALGIAITIPPLSHFQATPTTGAAPLMVAFTNETNDGGSPITAWQWSFGDGATSAAENPSHTYAQAGQYSVTLTAASALGETSFTRTGYIAVTGTGPDPVAPTASFTAAPVSGQAPLTVTFSNTTDAGSSPVTSWLWNFGDGAASAAANPTHTYTQPGVYTVSLTATSSVGGDTAVRSNYITVTGEGPSTVTWINPAGGDWTVGGNWDTGIVPQPGQLAVVEARTPAIAITVPANHTIVDAELNNNELRITGGTLTITGEVSLSGALTMEGNAILSVDGPNASLLASGALNTGHRHVRVRNGAQVEFPGVTAHSVVFNGSPTIFDVAGRGPAKQGEPSRLQLPNLATLTFNSNTTASRNLRIAAANEGEVHLPALAQVNLPTANDVAHFEVSGGVMDLASLTAQPNLLFDVRSASTLALPAIENTLANVRIDVGAGSSITLPGLAQLESAVLNISGGLTADGLESINASNATFRSNAAVTLPALVSMLNTNITIQENAALGAPALISHRANTGNIRTTLANNGAFTAAALSDIDNMLIQLQNGAALSLPGVASYAFLFNASPTVFDVSGTKPPLEGSTPSQLTFPNLTAITFNSGSTGSRVLRIRAASSGIAEFPALTTLTTPTANDKGQFEIASSGAITIDALATGSNLILTSSDGLLSAPAIAGALDDVEITALSSGAVALPAATSFANGRMTVGGGVSVPALTSVTGSILTFQDGANIALNNVTVFNANTLTVRGNASLSMTALETILNTTASVEGAGILQLPALTQYSSAEANRTLTVSGNGQFNAPNTANVNNVLLRALNGGSLALPAVTSYSYLLNASPVAFESSGTKPPADGSTPSMLDLGNLATLTFNSGSTGTRVLTVSAANSGQMDFASLTTVSTPGSNDRVLFRGLSNSDLALPVLATVGETAFTADGGSALTLPSLTGVLNNAQISVNTVDSSLALPNVTGLTNATVNSRGNLSMPALESITGTAIDLRGGVNAVWDLVTTLQGGSLLVREDAQLSLGALTSMVNVSTTVQNNASVSAPLLTSYTGTTTNVSLRVTHNGAFNTPQLATVTNLMFQLQNGGALTLPAVTSYAYNLNNSPVVMDVSGNKAPADGGAPSRLDLANLASVVFNSTSTGTRILRIDASSNGEIDLGALATVEPQAANDWVEFRAASGGSIDTDVVASGDGLRLDARAGGVLSFPAILALEASRIDTAAGASVSLPAVQSFSNVVVDSQGVLLAPALETVTGGSLTFRGSASNAYPALASMTDGNLSVTQNASLTAPAFATYTSSTPTASLFAVENNASVAMDNLATITNLRFRLRSGGVLSLPSVTASVYNQNSSVTAFDVDGRKPPADGSTPSMLTLANLTSITYNTGAAGTRTLTIVASNGGSISMPALTTVSLPGENDFVTLRATGADSLISAPSFVIPAGVTAEALNGGSVITNAKVGALRTKVLHAKSALPIGEALADLTGDGQLELLVLDTDQDAVFVYFGEAEGYIGDPVALGTGAAPTAFTVADVTGNGWRDIVIANHGSSDLTLWRGMGGGEFVDDGAIALPGPPTNVWLTEGADGGPAVAASIESADGPSVVSMDLSGTW